MGAYIEFGSFNLGQPMSGPLSSLITRLTYGVTQVPRVAWYLGHSIALRQLANGARRNGSMSKVPDQQPAPVPSRNRLYADMAKLFLRDLANVESGLYPLPIDRDGSLSTLINRSRLFFDDLPEIHRRRERQARREVLSNQTRGTRPAYYLQNFHYQSGGWMTAESAERYDTQVEVLFHGTANAIRRQAIPPLREVFAGRDQRTLQLVDVGCGTGRFLDFVNQTWPRLSAVGVDLSEPYIRHARRHLRRSRRTRLMVGKAEAIPLPDRSQDAIASIFLFHELPPKIRRTAFHEFSRVLKPGGRLVLVDSLQYGDEPDYDGLLYRFPQNYHEPYYASYLKEDFPALAKHSGLHHVRSVNTFISKVMVFDKPGKATRDH